MFFRKKLRMTVTIIADAANQDKIINQNDEEIADNNSGGEDTAEMPRFHVSFKGLVKRHIPITNWLPQYTISKFLHDLLAGFTVALTEIPQGISYAKIAGLTPEYGLYSGFMGCLMYFIFGGTKDINVGPTAIMAVMVNSHVMDMGPDMAVLLCFLSGCVIFIFGLLQLGFLIEFFSYPVIAGFTSAAALQIASTQINSLLGIGGRSNSFLDAFKTLFRDYEKTKLPDSLLGLFTIIFLFVTKEIRRYGSLERKPEWSKKRHIIGISIFMLSISRNALAVLAGSLIAYKYQESNGKPPFAITGKVAGGLPPFHPPPFSTTFEGKSYTFSDMISNFGTIVIFCPLIATLEHVAISKAFTKGKSLDGTQEMIALGISNVMSSFVRSMPITGSFTRTVVNNASGVKTTFGGVVNAIIVLLALGFLTSSFQYIPKATLAAVIMVAMFYLFEFEAFPVLWRTKKLDLIPFLVTLLSCLFINLEYGILIGIAVNIVFVLYTNARPKIEVEKEKLPQGDVYLVTPRTTLHYTASEYIRNTVLEKCSDFNTAIVVNGKYIGNIDATVAKSFASLVSECKLRKQPVYLWNFKQSVIDICLGLDDGLLKYFRGDDQIEDLLSGNSPEVPNEVISCAN